MGAVLYVIGHGLIKASLFLCAGMVLHRLQSIDELKLHGRGRKLPWVGVLFALGSILLAGAPPSALFFGESHLHRALSGNLVARFAAAVAAIATGAAVLRACGRIFLGLGPREPDAPGGGEADEEPETRRGEIPWSMWLPVVLLLALAIESAWVRHPRMVDLHGWAMAVLDNAQPAPFESPAGPPSFIHGAAMALGAIALAALTLFRKRLPQALRAPVRGVWDPLARGLRAMHTGEVGDQVAWLTLGAALLGVSLVLS